MKLAATVLLIFTFLAGCSKKDPLVDQALHLRKEVLEAKPDTIDPKKYNAAGREKVKEYVLGRIKVVGSVGKA